MTDSSTPRPEDAPDSGTEAPRPDAGATAPQPQVGPPTQPMPPAVPPFASPPPGMAVPTYAAAPPRPGARGLWRDATSTTGGRVATVVAAVFVALVVITGIGLGAAAIGRLGDDRRAVGAMPADRGHGMRGYGDGRPGPGGRADGAAPFGQRGRPDDGDGLGGGRGQGGRPDGLGPMSGLGGILHGEFVTGAPGPATTMLFQVGEVTAYTKGSSLAVRSSDGFATTYQVDAASRLVASAATSISVGDTVRVLATKDGPTVTTVQVLSSRSSGA